MKLHQAFMPLCLAVTAAAGYPLAGAAAPARDAIRVTVDGQTRVCRTVGLPTDAEFYAPLVTPLRTLWLDVQPKGQDQVEIRYQGRRVAHWPVVTHEEDLPADPGRPVVLREGDELLVPIKALVALGNGKVDWDDRTRTLTLTPTVQRLELHPTDRGLELRLEASAPVRVTSVHLAHPSRLAIDITPAWFQIDDAPQPAGVVRSVRLGQFTKETARVVMELSQNPVRVIGLPQSATQITARLQPGEDVARLSEPEAPTTSAPDAEAPAAPQPPSTSAALSSRLRGHRLLVRRGLASRGGFLRRDPSLNGEAPEAGVLAGKVICIDAGHGGWKSGAQGLNGLKEADACLAMAQQLERALEEAGATVIMPRVDDRYVSLEDRYTFANLKHADIFISIHCNAMQKHNTMSGTETYYWSPQSLDLARALHPEAVAAMGGRDGGIRRRAFAVIHHTIMPSILIEAGYIDNINDEARLGDPSFQETFGNDIRDGLIRYFGG